jgi:hypothetical protein
MSGAGGDSNPHCATPVPTGLPTLTTQSSALGDPMSNTALIAAVVAALVVLVIVLAVGVL